MHHLANKPKVTILTDPIASGRWWLPQTIRVIARTLRNYFQTPEKNPRSKYRGHPAVTRSLVEGLKKKGLSFNYNPTSMGELADIVVVLAGVRTLRQAIEFKKKGIIKTLSAGPNVVIFSTDAESIIATPEVDIVTLNSDWTVDRYIEDSPSLKGRCWAWPAGVDTDYWAPNASLKRDRVLVLDKRLVQDDPDRVKPYVEYLRGQGWPVDVLVRCGVQGYTRDEYRDLLHKSCLMVGFTVGSESQGIAWAEAWAADVPTLILRQTENICRGRKYHCSTAPFLQPENGLFFDDPENFKTVFASWESNHQQFSARAWTLANMSDEVCAEKIYRHLLPEKS